MVRWLIWFRGQSEAGFDNLQKNKSKSTHFLANQTRLGQNGQKSNLFTVLLLLLLYWPPIQASVLSPETGFTSNVREESWKFSPDLEGRNKAMRGIEENLIVVYMLPNSKAS